MSEAMEQEAASEMVERVARSLYDKSPGFLTYADPMDRWLISCRMLARTAIAAMREPTAEMICAGGDACREHSRLYLHTATKVWLAMVDAALAPASPGTVVSAPVAGENDQGATSGRADENAASGQKIGGAS